MNKWSDKTIEAAQKHMGLPVATRRVIALAIDVELFIRQCRAHERIDCEKCAEYAAAREAA